MTERERGFIQGFTCAVVIDIKNHGMRREVVDLWKCNSNSIQRLRSAYVDEGDIEVIKKHWEELNNFTPRDEIFKIGFTK